MRIMWLPPDAKGYWIVPAVVGLMLILIGVLIYVEPRLLAYFVAALFMLAGTVLLSIAWKMRARIRYRRIDQAWDREDE